MHVTFRLVYNAKHDSKPESWTKVRWAYLLNDEIVSETLPIPIEFDGAIPATGVEVETVPVNSMDMVSVSHVP